MLHDNKIYISKLTDFAKSKSNKECMICHYFFLNHGFNFQDYVCNRCHDLPRLNVNIRDIAIIDIAKRCIIHNISKSGAINLLENLVLKDCVHL